MTTPTYADILAQLGFAGAQIAQQQAEIAGLRAQLGTTLTCTVCYPEHDLHITCSGCPAEATRRYDYCDSCAGDMQRLRADLASADEHIGALVSAIDELDSLGEWVWSEADKATLLSIHLSEAHHTELTDRMLAARAFLRRRVER